jgi:hypothetical protein
MSSRVGGNPDRPPGAGFDNNVCTMLSDPVENPFAAAVM